MGAVTGVAKPKKDGNKLWRGRKRRTGRSSGWERMREREKDAKCKGK